MSRTHRGSLAVLASSVSLIASASLAAPAAFAAAEVPVFQNPATVVGTGSASGSAGSSRPGLQTFELEVEQATPGVGVVTVADSDVPCASPGSELEVTWSNFTTGKRGSFEVKACGADAEEPGERVAFGQGSVNFSTRVVGPIGVEIGSVGTMGSLVPSAYLSGNGSFDID